MKKIKIIFGIISIILVCCISYPCFSFSGNYTWTVSSPVIPTSGTLSETTEAVTDNFLNLDAGAAILIEQTTGQILYQHNIHERLHPASVTKIMSLLLIMEA